MASKQLDRLRQWAGEVISSREKSQTNDELRELEKDIDLRKDGLQRLLTASEAYHHALSKKKDSDALDEADKLLPIDSLGVVMIVHGEEFGEESPFGHALIKLGRAHCKVATLQEAYALTFKDTFVTSIAKFKSEIKEYELLRKKFDTRKSSYESAAAKFEKLRDSKKEKDRQEAGEEMDRAKQRYEETVEDMRAHMHAIQENEFGQHRELTSFLELETNFVQSYLDVLKDVKADWQQQQAPGGKRSRRGSQVLSNLTAVSKSNSVHSTRGLNGRQYTDSSDDEEPNPSPTKHKRAGSSASSRAPSRPASRLSRKRTNSTSAPPEQKEKEAQEKSRRMSVAGWASSAVDSVTGGKKKKKDNKDKDTFSSLSGEQEGQAVLDVNGSPALGKSSSFRGISKRLPKNKSKENLPASPKAPPRILKPPSLQDKKVVRALYDFSGSSDELSFKTGHEIVVLNEVLDDWWMGELDGKKGLFPTSYTEPVKLRPSNGQTLKVQTHTRDASDYITSDDDDDLRTEPMSIPSPFYGGFHDTVSLSDSMAESEDERRPQPMVLPVQPSFEDNWFSSSTPAPTSVTPPTPPARPRKRSFHNPLDPAQQPLISRQNDLEEHERVVATPTKKAPPPPPPRRLLSSNPTSGPPPIPERKVPGAPGLPTQVSSSSTSPSAMSHTLNVTPPSSVSSLAYDRSPFDSVVELGQPQCTQFRQNPFKPQGACSNCLEFH